MTNNGPTTLLLVLLVFSCASSQLLDINVIPKAFHEGVIASIVPPLSSKASTHRYKEKFANITKNLLHDFMRDVYLLVRKESQFYQDTLASYRDTMDFKMKFLLRDPTSRVLEPPLMKVNDLLRSFLEMGPGKVQLKSEAQQEIPRKENATLQYDYLSLKDVFVGFSSTADSHMADELRLIENMFLDGWQSARRSYGVYQNQLRSEFLNGPMLRSTYETVDFILKNAAVIQQHVRLDVWKDFDDLRNRIEKIAPQSSA